MLEGGTSSPWPSRCPARFIGIDSSPRQTGEARELIERLGLSNISVIERDILELDGSLGPFDYIICHGTFSWVLRQVQDKILEVFAASLAANGLAYISYNTYPGWHFRGLAREMMCYYSRRFEQPADRAREARTLLQFMTKSALAIEPVYSNLLKQELDYVTARKRRVPAARPSGGGERPDLLPRLHRASRFPRARVCLGSPEHADSTGGPAERDRERASRAFA